MRRVFFHKLGAGGHPEPLRIHKQPRQLGFPGVIRPGIWLRKGLEGLNTSCTDLSAGHSCGAELGSPCPALSRVSSKMCLVNWDLNL